MFISLHSTAQYRPDFPLNLDLNEPLEAPAFFGRPHVVESATETEKGPVSSATIGEMLDSLDDTFWSLSRSDCSASWTDKALRRGLRNMGPYIPYSGSETEMDRVNVDRIKKWPALIFVGVPPSAGRDTENKCYAHFFYAQKVKRFTYAAPTAGGVRYEVGAAYYDTKTDRHFWSCTSVTINPRTGEISLVPIRQINYAAVGRANRREHYATKRYAPQLIGETLESTLLIIASAFNFWSDRQSMWSVSAKKEGRRATFCIPDRATSSFFRDRNRTALTAEGRLRPIAHYVREHERTYPDGRKRVIPAHIRGLRHFDWNGYDCAVIAPEFHQLTASEFDIAGEEPDRSARKYIGADQLGQALADMEDDQRPMRLSHASMSRNEL